MSHLTCTPEAKEALCLEHTYRIASDPTSPVIFFVHGRAGTYDVMWLFRRAVPDSFHIITPQAPLRDPLRGFSWWQVHAHMKPNEEEVATSAKLLTGFFTKSIEYYNLMPRKILALGFSQGGGILSWGLQNELLKIDGMGFLASFLYPSSPVGTRIHFGAQRVFWAHGTQDEVVSCSRARLDVQLLQENGIPVEYREEDVGHKVGARSLNALKDWIASFS